MPILVPMDVTPRRRRALSTILAVFLAVESVSAVAAAAQVNLAGRAAAAQLAASVTTHPTDAPTRQSVDAGIADFRIPEHAALAGIVQRTAPVPRRPDPAAAARAIRAATEAPRAPKQDEAPRTKAPSSPATFRGRSHVWMPSLHVDRSVSWFPCDRTRDPDNHVYRWGCAGANNVYLLGHAYSVFKPLHDAYVGHRLRAGMKAYYADARGRVHAYAVRWWRLTLPTPDAAWAWAAQSRPSMTLQTCVGKNSRYRLIVRLVEVGR